MQAVARLKYLKMSPKKVRQVASLIKGKPVQEALNILNFTPKAAATHLAKTLKSAAANAIANVGTAKLRAEDLSVSKVIIDSGPIAKRARFQSMGRVFRIRKRFCHLTIEVEGEPEKETPKRRAPRTPKTAKEPVDKTESKPAKKSKAPTTSKAKAKKKVKETEDKPKVSRKKKSDATKKTEKTVAKKKTASKSKKDTTAKKVSTAKKDTKSGTKGKK
jgi:large subunit ribosomal protein L22